MRSQVAMKDGIGSGIESEDRTCGKSTPSWFYYCVKARKARQGKA